MVATFLSENGDIEMTAGTGSTFTAVPRTLLESLGVPVEPQATSRLAYGRTAPVDVGTTVIRLEEQTLHTPSIFAKDHDPALLGVVALGASPPGRGPHGPDARHRRGHAPLTAIIH